MATTKAAALSADAKKQLATNKRRATSMLALIERRKTRITEDFYDIGEALKEILDAKLYLSIGFESFDQMLEARKVMAHTQAFKLIRLVEGIPRDEALRLGQEKAYALVTYTAATPEDDVPAALVRRNAQIDGKPVSAMSMRELRAAATSARAATKRPETPAAKAKAKADQAVVKTAKALLKRVGVSKPDIQVKKDMVVVTIPRTVLEKLGAA